MTGQQIHTPEYHGDHGGLSAQLAALPFGHVRTWFTPDVVDTLSRLETATGAAATTPMVTVSWPDAADINGAVEAIVRALAGVALARWPDWYGARAPFHHPGIGAALAPEQDDRVIERLGATHPTLDRAWVRQALRKCRRDALPLSTDFPHAIQLRQLMLAAADSGMVLLLVLEDSFADPVTLLCFARCAAWVAEETGTRVAAFLPTAHRGRPELDPITYHAVDLPEVPSPRPGPRTMARAGATTGTQESATTGRRTATPIVRPPRPTAQQTIQDEPARLVIPPILGRPHPASPGEQLLATWLGRDAELASLFEFNQRVDTANGEHFVVDLLWRAGKMTVEVDGYTWHSGPHAFAADRYRDYRLLCDGYRTLRLPHDEVMDDPALQCEKIRDVVRAIQKEIGL